MHRLHQIVKQFRNSRLPVSLTIKEMGPRDGLQNEKNILPAALKIEFINKLSACGYKSIEVSSFVSPKWVPQMGDAAEVFSSITKAPGVEYPVLTPNLKGYEAARGLGVAEVAVFASATESFSQKNINCSIEESLSRFLPVMEAAYEDQVKVRGYVSCVLGCPYEGRVTPFQVRRVAKRLYEMGCYEVSLGDTIGMGTPSHTKQLIEQILNDIPTDKLAVHFHNTGGKAIENILTAVGYGVTVVDTAVGSLGGCPYAEGATGNVSTEDVVWVLHELGVRTGLDLHRVAQAAEWVSQALGRENKSLFRS